MAYEILFLSEAEVAGVGLGMADIISAVEAAFVEKGRGQVEMPPKPGIHTQPDAFIHAMPAFLKATGAAGMKWISGYPANTERGLPYISGLLILNDPETGIPRAVMGAAWITAMRTAAATAVAARYLARPDAASLAVLGCGVQGRSNTEALVTVLPGLRRPYAFDIRPEAARAFCREQRGRFGLDCEICDSAEAAVRGGDIVVTAGPILRHPSPVVVPEWIREGAFVCTLDFDSYATPELFRSAALFSTDDVAQFLHYQEAGYFAGVPPDPADLGAIVAAGVPARKTPGELTVSANLGLALEDIAVAGQVLRRAQANHIGTVLTM